MVTPSHGPQRSGTTTRGAISERSTAPGVNSRPTLSTPVVTRCLIVAVYGPGKGIHAEINRQAFPRRLVHRTESRLWGAAQIDGNLRLRIQEVFVTPRGKIDAEAAEIVGQKCRTAHLGIHSFAKGRREGQLKGQRSKLIEIRNCSPAVTQQGVEFKLRVVAALLTDSTAVPSGMPRASRGR